MDIIKAREIVRTFFFRGEVEAICSMNEIDGMMDPKAAYQVLLVYRKDEYVPNFLRNNRVLCCLCAHKILLFRVLCSSKSRKRTRSAGKQLDK